MFYFFVINIQAGEIMSELTKFNVSVPNKLLQPFDEYIAESHCSTCSKIMVELIEDR